MVKPLLKGFIIVVSIFFLLGIYVVFFAYPNIPGQCFAINRKSTEADLIRVFGKPVKMTFTQTGRKTMNWDIPFPLCRLKGNAYCEIDISTGEIVVFNCANEGRTGWDIDGFYYPKGFNSR